MRGKAMMLAAMLSAGLGAFGFGNNNHIPVAAKYPGSMGVKSGSDTRLSGKEWKKKKARKRMENKSRSVNARIKRYA